MKTKLEHILQQTQEYRPEDQELVKSAYLFAEQAHEGQRRENGSPYFSHIFATASLLADWRMPAPLIAAGFLHDVPEDTKHSLSDIEKHFGKDIASLVEGETKLSALKYRGKERYAENLRKMFLAIAQDIRVVIIKFADRVDNMRTLNIFPEDKRKRIARETLEIYAPIANRLGMGEVKGILEDLAFQYVFPEEYEWVKILVEEELKNRKQYLNHARTLIEQKFRNAGIPYLEIHGRTKRVYSLYKKLLKHDRDIAKIYDLVAVRIIVKSVADCYTALGAVHNLFTPLKGRIKDYIAQPKPNGYQSLHTTVFCEEGKIIEFQIRTAEMHEEAEYGIAAHWRYTEERGGGSPPPAKQVRWMQDLVRIQKELRDEKTFLKTLEELKIDVFQNRIFVFTPNGDVLDLPEGSTPVDFAYLVHTDLGNHCVRAQINGDIAPLDAPLKSGDIVKIITDQKRNGPSTQWLKFAKTRHAREKIRAGAHYGIAKLLKKMLPGGSDGASKKNRS